MIFVCRMRAEFSLQSRSTMDNTRPPDHVGANALMVGGGALDAERLAAALAPDAQVICFAADRAAASTVREIILARVPGARVAVMLGDPALLVHKVAGPFDLILDAHQGGTPRHDRLRALLAEGGELYD
jgi:hypothetical protein